MGDPDSTTPARPDQSDFRAFLRAGPDFDLLELGRAREPARTVDLDAVDGGGAGEVDER